MLRRYTLKEDERMVDQEMLAAMSEMVDGKLTVMSEMMDEKLTAMKEKMDQKFATMEEKMDQKFAVMEEKMDQKFAAMEETVDQKFDEKLQPIYDRLDRLESDMKYVRVVQLENNVIPRLNTIESCYVDTSKRYLEKTEQIDTMSSDIGSLKIVVQNHSEKLSRISV